MGLFEWLFGSNEQGNYPTKHKRKIKIEYDIFSGPNYQYKTYSFEEEDMLQILKDLENDEFDIEYLCSGNAWHHIKTNDWYCSYYGLPDWFRDLASSKKKKRYFRQI